MELLETSFSQTLSDFIGIHLKQHKSIPLFLSSLTVDLFNKQTFPSFSTIGASLACDVWFNKKRTSNRVILEVANDKICKY